MDHDVIAFRVGVSDVSLGTWDDATGRTMQGKALQCVQAIRSPDRATFNARIKTCPTVARTPIRTLWLAGVRDFDRILAEVTTGPNAGTVWPAWERRGYLATLAPERRLSIKAQAGTSRTLWDWTLTRRGETDLTGTVDVSLIAAPRRASAAMKKSKAAAAIAAS